MAEIEELDDTALRLRVLWRKTNNFYASFASILFDTKKQFEAGAYPGWEFDSWLFQKAGLPETYVMQQLKVFARVISAEARDKVEQAVIRQAVERRKAKAVRDAERQAEIAEKRAAAALKRQEDEKIRQEKAAEKAAREQPKLPPPQPPAGADKVGDKRREFLRREALRNKARRAAEKQAAAQAGPDNPVLRDGLTECRKIEASNRVQLGAVYIRLKEEVDMHRAGKNPGNGKFWTWGEWSSFYIKRSRASIAQCISDYIKSPLNVQGLDNSQTENVISFPQAIG